MTCHEAREQLSALIDDALAAPERVTVDAHLAACADCRRELERLRATVALLDRLPPARAPAGFVDRVLAEAYRPSWPRRVLDALFVPLRVKLPLEAVAVLLVSVSALYVYQRTPEVQEMARRAPREPAAPSPPSVVVPPAPEPAVPPRPAETRSAQAKRAPGEPAAAVREGQAPPEVTGPAPPAPPTTAGNAIGEAPVAKAQEKTADPESKKKEGAAVTQRADAPAGAAPAGSPATAPVTSEEVAKASEPSASRDAVGTGSRLRAAAPAKPPSLDAPLPDTRGEVGGTASARPPAPVARQQMRAVDASGRLTVPARAPAEQALDALLARLGGARVGRLLEGDRGMIVIDVLVPGARYRELIEGLARIGRWVTEYESPTLPGQVRVEVALTIEP